MLCSGSKAGCEPEEGSWPFRLDSIAVEDEDCDGGADEVDADEALSSMMFASVSEMYVSEKTTSYCCRR